MNEHLRILGDRAIIYKTKDELKNIFRNINNILLKRDNNNDNNDWNAYTSYTPIKVMNLFNEYIFHQTDLSK